MPDTQPKQQLPDLASTQEIAAYLGVPVTSVRYAAKTRKVPHASICGRTYLFDRQGQARLLDALEETAQHFRSKNAPKVKRARKEQAAMKDANVITIQIHPTRLDAEEVERGLFVAGQIVKSGAHRFGFDLIEWVTAERARRWREAHPGETEYVVDAETEADLRNARGGQETLEELRCTAPLEPRLLQIDLSKYTHGELGSALCACLPALESLRSVEDDYGRPRVLRDLFTELHMRLAVEAKHRLITTARR